MSNHPVQVVRVVVVGVLVLFVVSGCGSAKRPAAPHARPGAIVKLRLEHRLRSHGYTVKNVPTPRRAPYVQMFAVDHIDWTTPHAFSVSVFVFPSAAAAAKHRAHTAALVGSFPQTNKSKLIGSHLFLATADSGPVNCTLVNGKPRCPTPPGIATGDFHRVVAIAEGH